MAGFNSTLCPQGSNFSLEINVTGCDVDEPHPGPGGLDWPYILSHPTYTTIVTATKYRYYALVPVSLLGNILCFIIFYPNMRTTSGYFFMGQVALWDMVTVVTKGTKHFLDRNYITMGHAGCKVTSFLVAFCPAVAVWLVIVMTCDRLFVVTSPFRYRRQCSIRVSYIAYMSVIGFMVLLELQEFITMQSRALPNTEPVRYQCSVKEEYRKFYRYVWTPIYYSLFTVIPVILLTCLNALIVVRVRRKLGRMSESSSRGSTGTRSHVTRMSVVVSVVFVVCNVPQCVLFLMQSSGFNFRSSEHVFLDYIVAKHVAFTLQVFNHCINIFLYFVSGRKFRHDVIHLIRWRRWPSVTSSGLSRPVTGRQASNSSLTKTTNLSSKRRN